MTRSEYPDYVSYVQAYTTLLVSVKSRLWKDRVKNRDDDAIQGIGSVDYAALVGVSHSRWGALSESKRARMMEATLKDMLNPYEALDQLPVLFQTARERFGLCDDELRILLFLTITRTTYPLMSVFGEYWDTKLLILYQDLSVMFQMSLARVRRLLSAVGRLKKSGLISEPTYHSDVLEPMEGLACALMDRFDQSIDSLFSTLYECIQETAFAVEDFAHVAHHKAGLLRVLQEDGGSANVLIYGPPGTGKTELAKALVSSVSKVLYRLNPKNVNYDRGALSERIGAFYQLQAIVSHHTQAAILFDEVEEVFVPSVNTFNVPLKSLLNDLLETNRVPTIWICNSVEDFDPAFVRRFDYVLHLDYPDYASKRTFLRNQNLLSWISPRGLELVARHPHLGFGQLAPALKMVRSLPQGEFEGNDAQWVAMLNEYLRAMGQSVLSLMAQMPIEQHHMPHLYHTSVPLERLSALFHQCGSGRVLFHGPSGTGKSTAARQLVEQCGYQLKVFSGVELMAVCEHFGAGIIDAIFNEINPVEDVLLLEDVGQCLTPKAWQLGGLVDALAGRLRACLDQFRGFAIVITAGTIDDSDELFDVVVAFRPLQARQLAALERYAKGEFEAMDELTLSRGDSVVDMVRPVPVEQTTVTLADFHSRWRRRRVSEVINGSTKDDRQKGLSKRLSLVKSLSRGVTTSEIT